MVGIFSGGILEPFKCHSNTSKGGFWRGNANPRDDSHVKPFAESPLWRIVRDIHFSEIASNFMHSENPYTVSPYNVAAIPPSNKMLPFEDNCNHHHGVITINEQVLCALASPTLSDRPDWSFASLTIDLSPELSRRQRQQRACTFDVRFDLGKPKIASWCKIW